MANPKKERKPKTSVIVVKITPEANAGSTFNLSNSSTVAAPSNPNSMIDLTENVGWTAS